MENIAKDISSSRVFRELRERLKRDAAPIQVRGAAGSLLAFLTTEVVAATRGHVLLVASEEEKAEKLRDDCALLAGEACVRYFGVRSLHEGQMLDMTGQIAQTETLRALARGRELIVVASPRSIAQGVPPPGELMRTTLELSVKGEHDFQGLIGKLEALGFQRKDFVESYGDFAVRGGILDVFSHVGENPLRIEFWGNTVESIREFDVLSQRSIRELETAGIVPDLTLERASASLFDYLAKDALVILDEPAIIRREVEELLTEGGTGLLDPEEISRRATSFRHIVHSSFTEGEDPPREAVSFGASSQPSFNGSVSLLVAALRRYASEGLKVYLTCDTEEEARRLGELIEEVLTSPQPGGEGPPPLETRPPAYTIVSETVHAGFVFPGGGIALITEHEIFGRLKRRGLPKYRRFKGFSTKEWQQLKPGDYVVHIDHGIGIFERLAKLRVGGIEQEAIKLLFQDEDVLYVNLNFVSRLQKYSSQEGHVPKLNKLGSGDWERTTARAKRRVKDIARDIIALYARRKREQGFAFSPDTHWQKELEASFMYEDTADQAAATLDVKRDMENPSPMDRLVCGDVGFGKTEVAVRAAFKAVMDGKQVAVLVPTTILAIQHYNTFLDRLSRYTTRVEHITRFKPAREQRTVVEDLTRGSVDIIIGTHRLLSRDVAFKDLGLLVIDEEHRFGVAAKEKLRQLKASVDTLTLTATPIPRTLHFSLIGARDISLINTPPRNRLPIVTEIIAADSRDRHRHVIREAILRELRRGGQIYFVHDRVTTIDAIAEQVRAAVPEARIRVAHGQMRGHELERAMLSFLEKKFDILVCTKIIESGLDIPNVNTIIVNRADRFGLAELYQLRGRVGRSNVQAYAYLLIPPLTIMPKTTIRRLQAIEEFTELGSGFHLAMRDMEIRGSGNLLGAEQSGFIVEMGFEMYERVVLEAVAELRREEFQLEAPPAAAIPGEMTVTVDSDIEAYIPELYIEADAERLDVYRRLYRARNPEELDSLREELCDRFGEYPEEVEHLLGLVDLRIAAHRAGFRKVELKGKTLSLTLPDESEERFYAGGEDAPFQKLVRIVAAGGTRAARFLQEGKELKLVHALKNAEGPIQRINSARDLISTLTVIGTA